MENGLREKRINGKQTEYGWDVLKMEKDGRWGKWRAQGLLYWRKKKFMTLSSKAFEICYPVTAGRTSILLIDASV